jgi:hypothetical protein
LYGCETWSLPPGKERRRVVEYLDVRGLINRKLRRAGNTAQLGEKTKTCKVFVEGLRKILPRNCWCKWEDNIKMAQNIIKDISWNHLVVNKAINIQIP